MNQLPDFILQTAAETLQFNYQAGGVTMMEYPHSTGWRVLPCVATAQILEGEHRLDLENGQSRFLSSGDAICISPGIPHRSEKVSRAPSISRWSHFNLHILGSVDLCNLLEIPAVFVGEAAQRIGDINEDLAALLQNPMGLTQVFQKKALGLQLASRIVEEARMRGSSGAFLQYAEQLAPVLTLMHANPGEPLSREEMARRVHLSPSRFYVIFKAALGLSPNAYLLDLRLQRAQQLLIRTDLSINQVALEVGYPDPFHFSRLFKARLGISPSQYRNSVRKGIEGF